MYLAAHRVVSPVTGAEGINAFAYGHGPYVWHGAPPFTPEENPGTLFESSIEPQVAPPGNRVRSYLDVLTPDETPRITVERALQHLLGGVAADAVGQVVAGRRAPLGEPVVRRGEVTDVRGHVVPVGVHGVHAVPAVPPATLQLDERVADLFG